VAGYPPNNVKDDPLKDKSCDILREHNRLTSYSFSGEGRRWKEKSRTRRARNGGSSTGEREARLSSRKKRSVSVRRKGNSREELRGRVRDNRYLKSTW